MGANQFVKDFRRKWQVKKAMAYRQMVMARKDKQVQKDAKVPLENVIQDKNITHHTINLRLQSVNLVMQCWGTSTQKLN